MAYTANSWSSTIPTYSRTGPIVRLNETEPLARLHANFWPTIMKDGDEHTGDDDNEDAEDGKDMGINSTEDTQDSDDGEVGSGCYILDLCIPEIHPKVWVRKDYIRLYNYCTKYVDDQRENKQPLSVVITGQPGIGKTYWVIYALHRCLTEGKPVIWYRDSRKFLFVKEGVYVLPDDFPATTFETRVWTLVDSNESPTGVPPRFAVHYTKHFNIYTSSPQSSRWKPLEKTTQCRVVLMNPWSREEISQAVALHGLAPDNPDIDAMYDHFGPTPRICFEYVRNPALLVTHQEHQSEALSNFSVEKLRNMVQDTGSFSSDSESHAIFLVKRVPKMDLIRANLNTCGGADFCYASVEPITSTVKVALRNELWKQPREEQLILYNQLKNVKSARRIAGLVFESLVHSKLQQEIKLELIPMVKRPSSGCDHRRWHSALSNGTNPSPMRPLYIKPARMFAYPGSSLEKIEEDVYYVPESDNQVAFDSFIVSNGSLFIFQISIASYHPIKKGIVSFFSQESLPPKENWNFVFVIPAEPGSEISCLQSQDVSSGLNEWMDDVQLLSAKMDLRLNSRPSLSKYSKIRRVLTHMFQPPTFATVRSGAA